MDNLTHGLVGLAIGALRKPDGGPGTGRTFSPTDKAVLFASVVAALSWQPPRVPMARAIAWELDLLGSHGMAAVDYPEMLALIAAGALRPDRLVERTVDLAEAARLLPVVDSSTLAGITVVVPG